MPFNPTLPVTNSEISSAELREQFNSLKSLTDALDIRVTALEQGHVTRRGVVFNGLDNYAVHPSVAWPATGTLELWIKVTGTINDLWPGVAGDAEGLPGTDGNVTGLPGFEFYGAEDLLLVVWGTYVEWFNSVDWSVWHHLALTWDAGIPKARMFVDGIPAIEMDTMNVPVSSPAPMQLGYPTRTNEGLEMALAEVRLSSVVRYERGFTPAPVFMSDGDTVALYKFTEQSGLTVGDSSGNGNDLTLTALPDGTLPEWFTEG